MCQCPEFIRYIPDTILNDGVSSTRLEVKTAPGTQSVTLLIEDSRFVFGNRTVCGEKAEIPLRDDGQEGDQQANDGIFTLDGIRWDTDPQHAQCNQSIEVPLWATWEGFTQAAIGDLVLANESGSISVSSGLFKFKVLDAKEIIAPDPIFQVAPEVQIASHAINILVSDFIRGGDIQAIAQKLYERITDDYDFLFAVWPHEESSLYCNGRCTNLLGGGAHTFVKSSVAGIGADLFDYSAQYGSQGRLKGLIQMDKASEDSEGIFFHEFMHQWGNYFSADLGIGSRGHFSGKTNISNWDGGCRWGDNGDGPDGHFKIPHLWPGQNPPPRATAGQ